MYCPKCGERQVNDNTRFCSRCGFLLLGLDEVIKAGGLPKAVTDKHDPNAISPRRRGLKQGGFMFLSGMVIVPLFALITETFHLSEFFVALAAMSTFLAGFVRMVYALIFQSGVPTLENETFVQTVQRDLMGKNPNQNVLPEPVTTDIPIDFQKPIGNWRETEDLQPNQVQNNTK